jgi:hypothetical protein
MKPSDFLSIDDFANLTGEEQADYVQAFLEAFHELPDDADGETKLAFVKHYFDLAEQLLSPAEFEKQIRSKLWDTAWSNSDLMVEVIERGIASGDLTDEEIEGAPESLQRARALAEHKHTLDGL